MTAKMKLLMAFATIGIVTGCSSTNLARVIEQLKNDPATVEFNLVAPGYAVQFKRAYPTNFLRAPASTLQYAPGYLPPLPPLSK